MARSNKRPPGKSGGKKERYSKALILHPDFRKDSGNGGHSTYEIYIDPNVFEKLCYFQNSLDDICHILSASYDTVNRFCKRQYILTFANAHARFAAGGKVALRQAMFEKALIERDTQMQKFLGVNVLDMSANGPKDITPKNQTTVNNNNNSGAPITLNQDIKIEVEYVKKKAPDPESEYEKEDYDKRFDDEFEDEIDDSLTSEIDEDADAIDGEVIE